MQHRPTQPSPTGPLASPTSAKACQPPVAAGPRLDLLLNPTSAPLHLSLKVKSSDTATGATLHRRPDRCPMSNIPPVRHGSVDRVPRIDVRVGRRIAEATASVQRKSDNCEEKFDPSRKGREVGRSSIFTQPLDQDGPTRLAASASPDSTPARNHGTGSVSKTDRFATDLKSDQPGGTIGSIGWTGTPGTPSAGGGGVSGGGEGGLGLPGRRGSTG